MKKRNVLALLILFVVIFAIGWFLGKRDSILWVWLAESPDVAETEEDIHRQNPHLPTGQAADGLVADPPAGVAHNLPGEPEGESFENHFLPSGLTGKTSDMDAVSGYAGRAHSSSYIIPAPEHGASLMVCANEEMFGRETDNWLGQLQGDFAEQGANVSFWVMRTQAQAVDALHVGQCSGAVLSAAAMRPFNRFAATVDALGAISEDQFGKFAELFAAGKLDEYLRQGDYEVVGIWLVMPQYLISRGEFVSIHGLQGRSFSAIKGDEVGAAMIRMIGANSVMVRSEAHAYEKYTAGAVDVMLGGGWLPGRDYRRLDSKSWVYSFRQGVVTAQMVLRVPDVTDETKSQLKSAVIAYSMSEREKRERLKEKYGEGELGILYSASTGNFSEAEWAEWEEVLRDTRRHFVEKGVYSPTMLALLKRLRCKDEPTRQECIEDEL